MNGRWGSASRRGLLAALALTAVLGGQGAAAAYPDHTVKVVVGFSPGGTNDILARIVAARLQDKLRQPFVVENRAGANSIIAADYVAKAPADGYTLFVASAGALTVNPGLYSKLSYDPVRDFQPVALLGAQPLVVTVNSSSPARTLADMKVLAKNHSDGSITHGVSSSVFQLAAELYARDAGIKLTHVNYKGTAPVVAALLGNEVDVAFVDIMSVVPNIKAGKLRALAVTTSSRSPILPDVPTVAETGMKNYEAPVWTGLVVPIKTPPEVATVLEKALREILVEPDVVRQLQALGMEPGKLEGVAFGKLIASDLSRWTTLAKDAGITAD